MVQDVLFNALLCRADKDLAQIARILGEDSSPLEERAQKTAHAINEKLWDEQHGIYLDFDLASGRLLEVYVTPNFVPLYAGIPDEERARRMVESCRTQASAYRTKTSRRCRATTGTALRSCRPSTGGDRSGST
jgi:neutral trehalase